VFIRMRLLIIVGLLCLPVLALAQQGTPPVPPETAQFDFWVGDWDAMSGDQPQGTNHIAMRWDRVVVEEFKGKNMEGHSVSVYDTNAKCWKQTWVDSQGGYLDFMGGFADGKMTLSRSFTQGGKTIQQRMVYYNITPAAFDWNWERSDDGGKTWKVNWNIHYTRKK
jgi:hypothetical protein